MLKGIQEKLAVASRLGWRRALAHVPHWIRLRLLAILALLRGRVYVYGVQIGVRDSQARVPWPNILGLVSGAYEQAEVRLLRQYLHPDLPVIELGASLGVVSCITNRALSEPTKHLVVEANPSLIPLLENNKSLNACSFSIKSVGIGPETAELHIQSDARSASMYRKTTDSIRVPCISFTELIMELGWDDIFLICDIEGGEDHLISLEGETLRKYVRYALFEFHPRILGSEVVDRLNRKLEGLHFSNLARDGDVSIWENGDV